MESLEWFRPRLRQTLRRVVSAAIRTVFPMELLKGPGAKEQNVQNLINGLRDNWNNLWQELQSGIKELLGELLGDLELMFKGFFQENFASVRDILNNLNDAHPVAEDHRLREYSASLDAAIASMKSRKRKKSK